MDRATPDASVQCNTGFLTEMALLDRGVLCYPEPLFCFVGGETGSFVDFPVQLLTMIGTELSLHALRTCQGCGRDALAVGTDSRRRWMLVGHSGTEVSFFVYYCE